NPGRYECPGHKVDVTDQVKDALGVEARPVVYRRRHELWLGGRSASAPALFVVMVTCPGAGRGGRALADLRGNVDPVAEPVRRAMLADQAWADLAAQLTPAASLARIGTVTARAIGTVTVLGVLITGLGARAAGHVTGVARPAAGG